MQPGSPFCRAANWLAQGDNAFNLVLWTLGPALIAIIGIGW